MAERQLYIARKTVIEMLTDRGLNSKYIKGFDTNSSQLNIFIP